MDSFFDYDFFRKDEDVENSLILNNPFPVNQSAFVPYNTNGLPLPQGSPEKEKKNNTNVNNRMVEFLKKNPAPPVISAVESERERNHKHVINERMRREKEKQSYQELHKLLPHGTKRDKKSIVQSAAREVEELESYKAKLQKKNKELKKALGIECDEEAKIKIRVAYPSSGIDSMLEVLKCLKSKGSVPKSIQSNFSPMEFSSLLQIQTSVEAAEVENAVQKTLYEVERKFRCPNFDLDDHISASARFHDQYSVIK